MNVRIVMQMINDTAKGLYLAGKSQMYSSVTSPLRVVPKQLCASAHVGCTRAAGTSQYLLKQLFIILTLLEKLNCIIELMHSESQNRKAFYTMSHTSSRERERNGEILSDARLLQSRFLVKGIIADLRLYSDQEELQLSFFAK